MTYEHNTESAIADIDNTEALVPAQGELRRRSFLASSLLLGGLSAMPVAAALAEPGAPLPVSPAMERAWRRYLAGLEQVRRKIYTSPFAADAQGQVQAHYLFHQAQALAFNSVIAPRQDYPVFHTNTLYEPLMYTWAGYVPDFFYRTAFLDGARTFRIWGKRGNTRMVLLQVSSAYWNEPPERARPLGSFDLDDFKLAADGSFEIIASAERHPGNWLPLDANSRNNVIGIRDAFYDWSNETGAEFHIEAIDDRPPRPILLDEDEFITRLEGAVRYMEFVMDNFAMTMAAGVIEKVGYHRFLAPEFPVNRGASPDATYNILVYDLKPDEALIIESEIPDPKFWNIVLADVWAQCVDYTYHQSSLNGHQARVDADGKFRVVLSARDPGVPNWIDPAGNLRGKAVVRWYFAQRKALPSARKVAFDQVRDYLPKDTPMVSVQQRKAALGARRRAVLRRYGH